MNFWKKRFKNLVEKIEEVGGEAATCSHKMCANVCIDMYICCGDRKDVDWTRCCQCKKLMDHCNHPCMYRLSKEVSWWKIEYMCKKCESDQ